jgi:hypothetical protein
VGNLEDEVLTKEAYEVILNIRELLGAIFIQEQRNYDMLSIIANQLGADAKGLTILHESGKILAPAPSFIFEEETKNYE